MRPIRRSIYVVLYLLCTLNTSCGLISFDVGQDLPEQTVQGSVLGGLLPGFIPSPIPITVNLQSETQKRNTGPASHAYLKDLTLSATPASMPSGTFDFLSEAHILIASSGNSALPQVEIATLKPVPKGQTSVSFTIVPNVDLLPYINAGAQITATATGTQPSQTFTYNGHIDITVKI